MNNTIIAWSPEQQRVLVVDDNVEAAEMLQVLLEVHGYVVKVASSGVLGLAIQEEFKPQVICTDLNMPGMSGFEFARAVRASSQPAPRLIAMSGEGHSAEKDIVAAGFDQSLLKPFSLDELLVSFGGMVERNV